MVSDAPKLLQAAHAGWPKMIGSQAPARKHPTGVILLARGQS